MSKRSPKPSLDPHTLDLLDFHSIRRALQERCFSEAGRLAVEQQPISTDPQAVEELKAQALSFRRLLESNALAPEVAEAVLRSARAHKRAVVTYMVLVFSDEPRRARLVEAVRSAFAGCEGADEARPLAVGAFAAALFHARTERIASPGRALLRDLRTRLTNDGQAKVQDPVLQRIFGLRGLDTK